MYFSIIYFIYLQSFKLIHMKVKRIILTIALYTFFLTTLAQEKNDYLIIEYNTRYWEISVSLAGREFKSEKVDFSQQDKSGYNANPFILKVNEFESKGWELINFNSVLSGPENRAETYFAYMKKKKTDSK